MDFYKLENFIVLSQELNYKKAAQKLGISPSVLSARIFSLENDMGKQLFSHQKRQVSLTDAGKLFLKDAKDLWQQYQTAQHRLHETQTLPDNQLKLASSGLGLPPRIDLVLKQLYQQFPTLDLKLYDDSLYQISNSLLEGQVDLYFSYLSKKTSFAPDIVCQPLYDIPLCALLPRSHHLAHRTTLSIQELEGENFYIYPRLADNTLHDLEIEFLQNSGIHYHIKESYSKTFYQIAVGVELGVALCPWVLRDYIPPTVVPIPLVDAAEFTMYMLYMKNNSSLLVSKFMDILKHMEF